MPNKTNLMWGVGAFFCFAGSEAGNQLHTFLQIHTLLPFSIDNAKDD